MTEAITVLMAVQIENSYLWEIKEEKSILFNDEKSILFPVSKGKEQKSKITSRSFSIVD